MPVRRVFYSFHYEPDNWRAGQVRNIGAIEGNQPARDNDWEAVKRGGDAAIKRWIADQMSGRSCTVVLVGAATANRQWINHEIIESWRLGMGIVGIRIHGLQDRWQRTTIAGANPFDSLTFRNTGAQLSSTVKCYSPTGTTSQERYGWIRDNLSVAVEEAIRIRKAN